MAESFLGALGDAADISVGLLVYSCLGESAGPRNVVGKKKSARAACDSSGWDPEKLKQRSNAHRDEETRPIRPVLKSNGSNRDSRERGSTRNEGETERECVCERVSVLRTLNWLGGNSRSVTKSRFLEVCLGRNLGERSMEDVTFVKGKA